MVIPIDSAGECVDSLASHSILFPQNLLAMPGNEKSDLAGGQSVILHLAIVAQRSDDIRRCTFRICSHVSEYLILQAHESRQFLTSYSV